MIHDKNLLACCGETELSNAKQSLITMMQVCDDRMLRHPLSLLCCRSMSISSLIIRSKLSKVFSVPYPVYPVVSHYTVSVHPTHIIHFLYPTRSFITTRKIADTLRMKKPSTPRGGSASHNTPYEALPYAQDAIRSRCACAPDDWSPSVGVGSTPQCTTSVN